MSSRRFHFNDEERRYPRRSRSNSRTHASFNSDAEPGHGRRYRNSRDGSEDLRYARRSRSRDRRGDTRSSRYGRYSDSDRSSSHRREFRTTRQSRSTSPNARRSSNWDDRSDRSTSHSRWDRFSERRSYSSREDTTLFDRAAPLGLHDPTAWAGPYTSGKASEKNDQPSSKLSSSKIIGPLEARQWTLNRMKELRSIKMQKEIEDNGNSYMYEVSDSDLQAAAEYVVSSVESRTEHLCEASSFHEVGCAELIAELKIGIEAGAILLKKKSGKSPFSSGPADSLPTLIHRLSLAESGTVYAKSASALLNLPDEMLHQITEFICSKEFNSLICCCKATVVKLNRPEIYRNLLANIENRERILSPEQAGDNSFTPWTAVSIDRKNAKDSNQSMYLRQIWRSAFLTIQLFRRTLFQNTAYLKDSMSKLVDVSMKLTPAAQVWCSNSVVNSNGVDCEDPRLYIPAMNMHLKIPLQPSELKALITTRGERAPFGKGSDTILDLDQRRTWRFPMISEVMVTNPQWLENFTISGGSVPNILDEIKETLAPNMNGEIVAQPYQMLIYEEGDFFKEHADTLRYPSHLGSLVVSLPVSGNLRKAGGRLMLYPRDEGFVACPDVSEDSGPVWSAFFTDIPHEVTSVTSGFRVSLTYHLIRVETASSVTIEGDMGNSKDWSVFPTAPVSMRHKPELNNPRYPVSVIGKTLSYMLRARKDFRFIFPLIHHYSRATLCVDNLRGDDYRLYSLISRSLSNFPDIIAYPVAFHLTNLNKFGSETKYFPGQYDDSENFDASYDSATLVCINEKVIAENADPDRIAWIWGNDANEPQFGYTASVLCVNMVSLGKLGNMV